MAITDPYAWPQEYRAWANVSDTEHDETRILPALKAVSRMIDRKLGLGSTGFNKDEAAVARTFLPDPHSGTPELLFIPALSTTPTSIIIDTDRDGDFSDETALDLTLTGDVRFLPENYSAGAEPKPITAVQWNAWGSYCRWPKGSLVQITGLWGWPSVPEAVKAATLELTSILLLESPRATQQITEVDQVIGISAVGQQIVKDLISQYRTVVL